ncbi:Putative periplasmic ATP /GTP-binding protein [hydrothermal vent metagenome]|uniref:Putative periplasmic ATP /GTP-binding protein n=1 Tax=hydrothermal vent metagenome TaxID=652676 RepID=A0A1W1BII1_9ZZZZ
MKRAFTMIELIFVIVVIGILAATIIPRMQNNPTQEAAIDLISKLRYTQHLALVDDKYDSSNPNWFKDRWRIVFSGETNSSYSIQDSNSSYAKDPLTRTKEIKNQKLRGVDSITFSGGCDKQIINFDYLGRPLIGDLTAPYDGNHLLKTPCTITLHGNEENACIIIEPESGYIKACDYNES